MNSYQLLTAVLMIGIIILLNCYMSNKKNNEYFSPSTRPFEPENSLLNRNPFDGIDYITPSIKMINTREYDW
jgi:hypothetical protein